MPTTIPHTPTGPDAALLITCGAFMQLETKIEELAEKASNVRHAHPATRALDAFVAETRPRWDGLVETICTTPAQTDAGRVAKAAILVTASPSASPTT